MHSILVKYIPTAYNCSFLSRNQLFLLTTWKQNTVELSQGTQLASMPLSWKKEISCSKSCEISPQFNSKLSQCLLTAGRSSIWFYIVFWLLFSFCKQINTDDATTPPNQDQPIKILTFISVLTYKNSFLIWFLRHWRKQRTTHMWKNYLYKTWHPVFSLKDLGSL